MAGLRKDVELIFRGEDRASPTIKNVRKSVADLTKAITDQTAAADRGEGSVDELAKAYRGLKDAQGDVGEIAKIAAAYENLSTKLGEQAKKTDEARAKSAQLTAQLAAAEKPTKRLSAEYEANERKLQSAIATEERYKAELIQLGAALDSAGGDSKNFAATQERVRQAAIETARAIRDAAAAMDQFKGKQAQGRAGVAAQEEALAFNQMAAGSGLPQAQIAFISTLENRLEQLNLAIREDQASMAGLNRELGDRAAADAAQRIQGMARSLDEADAAAARLKATASFRQMASEIEAGARDISRFGAVTDTAAVSSQRLADAVQQILQPTQAAAGNLQTVNTILAASEAAIEGPKRRLSEYNAELNNLQAASAGLTNIAGLIDGFRQQEAAVEGATAAFGRAQAEVLQLATAMQTADVPTEEMANALKRAEGALETAGAAMQRETSKLKQMEAGLTSAGVDVKLLDAAQEQLISSSNRLAAAQTKITSTTKGKGSFLGLNPNEMTNLGFQVNDIIVSLISGQKPLLVFAQQGAQIGQIIPGAFAKIVKFAGPILILVAVFGTLAAAFKKAADEAERIKLGQGIATQMGAGTEVTAQQFTDLAASMEKAGIKAEEVREKLVQLAADGLNTAQMEQYIATAKAVATVTGVEMSEALETVRDHFQGGMEDIIALDAETNAYTDTELDLIQTLYDQGKADEARTLALSIYQGKMETVAQQSQGPWSSAMNSLSGAWSNFLGWLSRTGPIENARRNMRDLAVGAAYVAEVLNQVTSGKGFDHNAAARKALGIAPPRAAGGGGGDAAPDPNRRTRGGDKLLGEGDRELRKAKATTRAQREALVVEEARNKAASAGLSTRETALYVTQQTAVFAAGEDKKDAKRATAAGKRADAAARKREAAGRRAAKAAESEANKIERLEEGLLRSLESLDSKVAKNSTQGLEVRLTAIDSEYEKLFRSIEEYSARTGGKGLIGGRTVAQAVEHVKVQKQALKNYETIEDYEKSIGDLEKERSERLDRIADQVERGIIKPEDGLIQSKAVLDEMAGRISQMAVAGLAFAASIKGANPSPELLALISKFETAVQNNSGGQNARATSSNARDSIDAQEQNLNNILSARNDLIEVEQTLVALGLQTRKAAEANIQAEFANSRQGILDQIDAIRKMRDAYKGELTPAMSAYFAALEGRLKIAATQVDYTSESFTNLRSQMNEILTSNIVGFIDSIAQAFARLATGQESALGVLEAIGRAFLEMIANILKTVAMLIIQALILNAVDKLTGGILKPLLQVTAAATKFHEGGVVGNNGAGSRKGNVSPMVFANAPTYHSGGIAGLAPDEMGAILKKNEEVLTENDPRHRFNGGMNPAGGQSNGGGIRQVLAIGDDEIAGAMAGAAGESTVITHIKRNKATIKQMLEN